LVTTVTGHITVYAQWTPDTYTVTFNKNNTDSGSTEANPATGTVTTSETTVGTLPTSPARPGWTFNGWNTQANGGGSAFNANTAVTGNITVYAQWNPVSYTVTFNKNNTDAGSAEANPATITVTTPATNVGTLPAPPERLGWTFNGWNTQANGGGTAFNADTAITGDITVYAQWIPWTVTFNKNNTDAGSTEANPPNMFINTSTMILDDLPTPPARPGWTFAGWNTRADGGGTAFTASTPVTGNITVYARWIPDSNFSVTFAQITDAAPSITGPVIHRSSANGQTTATVTLDNPGQYGGIAWHVAGTNVRGNGPSFTLNSANSAYYNIGNYHLTLEVIKDGVPYNRTITFKVEP